jgi:hypothetical protein
MSAPRITPLRKAYGIEYEFCTAAERCFGRFD